MEYIQIDNTFVLFNPEQCENKYTRSNRAITCREIYNCCDCGGKFCGCDYCFSCKACEYCLEND